MTGNDFMSWVLRSPFHAVLSNGMMLITVTGRKTEKKITLPVGYYRAGEYLWVLTSRDRTWWKNLRDGADVSLLVKREVIEAYADLIIDSKPVQMQMRDYLKHVPQSAKPLGIRKVNGDFNSDDITRIAKERLFVRIKLLA